MALLILGSLAAAMGIVAQANLAAADRHNTVNRATGAADTGLGLAARRLSEATRRFVIQKGQVDGSYAADIWNGSWSDVDGEVEILPAVSYVESPPADSLKQALKYAHQLDCAGHAACEDDSDHPLPGFDAAGVLHTPPIYLTVDELGEPDLEGPHFRLSYTMHPTEPYVIVRSIGADRDLTRTAEMWFRLTKKIEFALLSPSRIMLGSNVRVEGPLGSRYGIAAHELNMANGDPLVMKSDFYGLPGQATLDAELDSYFEAMTHYDTDGNNQLSVNHTIESMGVGHHVDHDGDEYVSDWDIFLAHFDQIPQDGKVVYDSTHTRLTEEFKGIDDQLARLIDFASPDRNDDGIIEGCDDSGLALDCKLGYGDGVLDGRDGYSKVMGKLVFAVSKSEWESAHGASYQTVVRGPVRPGIQKSAVQFETPEDEMRELTTEMFSDSLNVFDAMALPESAFEAQVAEQDSDGAVGDPASGAPDWIDPSTLAPVDQLAYWESTPWDAPGAYDHYLRPQYHNMTFTDVRIPMGNNGLFVNCTFKGITFIETESTCDYDDWNYMGTKEPIHDEHDDLIGFTDKYPQLGSTPIDHPVHGAITDTKPYSNNIRFSGCTFIGSLSARRADQYCHWRNKIQLSGNTRFYIDELDPDLADQPDAHAIKEVIRDFDDTDRLELAKSSFHCVGWSGDMGNFTNDHATKVKLKGTIICGLMDIRGTADVFGTLLMTYRPAFDEGPLAYGGQPDAFNTTIGYFGTEDGDREGHHGIKGGEISLRYDPDAIHPDGVPWSMKSVPEPFSYIESGQ